MSKYPQLTEMGVVHPQQIDRYSVNSIGYTDVLRIVYERPKGSILPLTRTYQFPRVQDTTPDVAEGEDNTVMSTHPCLRKATEELEDLLAEKVQAEDLSANIIEELALLQEDVAFHSECIKQLLDKMQAADD